MASISTLTLEQACTAIERLLLTGQSYTVADVTLNRGNLKELMAFRDQLRSEDAQSDGGAIFYTDFNSDFAIRGDEDDLN